MFGLFENNNIGDVFKIKSENYLDVVCTIISVDKNVLGIHLYDNYNSTIILDFIPVYTKDFNRSNVIFIGKDDKVYEKSLKSYNQWQNENLGVFNKTIEDLLNSFPSNRIVFLKEDNKKIRDYSLIKQKGITSKAIYSNDGRNIIGLYPLNKKVLLPSIEYPEGDLIVNNYDFIKLGTINVDKNEINIGFFNYSYALSGNYDIEMFNFSYKTISDKLYNILRVIKIFDKDILLFEKGLYIKKDDFEIEFDNKNNNYVFRWFKNEYRLSRDATELLITKYIILLNKFIREKKIIIDFNNK